jgi:catechol 2,3-dioxygenase-like lactoylglutathione lyase family enzyme
MQIRRGETNLYVSDLEKSAAFYEAALGFEVAETGEGYRKLSQGELVLTLFPALNPGPAPTPGMVPHMSCDLIVDDDAIEAIAAKLAAAGVEVTPLKSWAQGRHLMFRDPDGIGWELLSR